MTRNDQPNASETPESNGIEDSTANPLQPEVDMVADLAADVLPGPDVETLQQVYVEAGQLYRQFSGRRGRLFAGFLLTTAVIIGATVAVWVQPSVRPLAWTILAAGCLLTLVFWALERRTRQVAYACVQTGSRLERALGLQPELGVFTSLTKLPSGEPAPGRTFDWMYLVAALAFLVGTLYTLTEWQ